MDIDKVAGKLGSALWAEFDRRGDVGAGEVVLDADGVLVRLTGEQAGALVDVLYELDDSR